MFHHPFFPIQIDADVQNCSSFEWSDPVFGDPHPERFAVTLKEGKTLIFNNQGILLQHDPVQDEAVRSFSAHFTGAAPPCNRASPDIATGIRGEWSVCESAQTNDGKCDFDANEGMQKLAGFSRKSKHTVNGISNRDTIGCGDVWQGFAIEAASDLPAGWVFAPMLLSGDRDGGPGCEGAGFCSRANFDFLGGRLVHLCPPLALSLAPTHRLLIPLCQCTHLASLLSRSRRFCVRNSRQCARWRLRPLHYCHQHRLGSPRREDP